LAPSSSPSPSSWRELSSSASVVVAAERRRSFFITKKNSKLLLFQILIQILHGTYFLMYPNFKKAPIQLWCDEAEFCGTNAVYASNSDKRIHSFLTHNFAPIRFLDPKETTCIKCFKNKNFL
jgi:hypothetical protein